MSRDKNPIHEFFAASLHRGKTARDNVIRGLCAIALIVAGNLQPYSLGPGLRRDQVPLHKNLGVRLQYANSHDLVYQSGQQL